LIIKNNDHWKINNILNFKCYWDWIQYKIKWTELNWNNEWYYVDKINNKIYLYKMLTMNLLQVMLVRRAKQSYQHWQSSNSALLIHWVYTQLKSEAITTQSLMHWSLYIHRVTATSLHTCCNLYTIYTYILRRHDSAFAHIKTDVMQ